MKVAAIWDVELHESIADLWIPVSRARAVAVTAKGVLTSQVVNRLKASSDFADTISM